MAKILMVSGKFLSMKNDGTPNAGGFAYFWTVGTSTPLTTYSDYALSIANAHPVVLDSAGRAIIYFDGDADITVQGSDSVTIYTQSNVNPTTNSALTQIASAETLTSIHNNGVIELTGTGYSLSLTSATTLGAGWQVYVDNIGGGSITLARLNVGNSIDGTVANFTIPANWWGHIVVNSAETGFLLLGGGNTALAGTFSMSGKAINEAKGANVASVAGTTDIWTPADGQTVHITGTNAITGFGTAPQSGAIRHIVADGAFTLTDGANLVCPGNVNLLMEVDDSFDVYADTTTKMYIQNFTPAAGVKRSTKDHGTQGTNYTLQLDEADMHVVGFSASVTLTIASRKTIDKALVVVKNGSNAITMAGIDNLSPTLTNAASKQDFLAISKSFGKITCLSTNLNQATT